jgi:hypothetical protein
VYFVLYVFVLYFVLYLYFLAPATRDRCGGRKRDGKPGLESALGLEFWVEFNRLELYGSLSTALARTQSLSAHGWRSAVLLIEFEFARSRARAWRTAGSRQQQQKHAPQAPPRYRYGAIREIGYRYTTRCHPCN